MNVGGNIVMNDELQIFENVEFGKIRTLILNNEVWFAGKDIAQTLGYERDTKAVIDHVDEEDRKMVDRKTQSQFGIELGQRGGWIINESGLYSLILSSKLPTAKKFKHWVTSEVLPAIRKTGSYILPDFTNPVEAARAWANEYEAKQKALAQVAMMKPKAEYFDCLVDRNLLTNFRTTAKELGIKQNQFINWLLENNYVYRDNHNKLMPYAQYEEYFCVKDSKSSNSKWAGTQTLITPKGKEAFRLLLGVTSHEE